MKRFIPFFSLLFLIVLQEGFSTHLETCDCNQIRGLINTTVREVTVGLEDRLTKLILLNINLSMSNQSEARLTTTIKELLEPIQRQLNFHLPPPSQFPRTQAPPSQLPPTQAPPLQLGTRDSPAISCKDLLENHPNTPSGYYWINQTVSPARIYCSMSETCGNETGGWMRVANIDMRNTSQSCPSGLTLISSPKRVCDITSRGCVSNRFSVQGFQYNKVCGKIISYQYKVPIAFIYGSRGFERDYVYGVSLTHGQNPRKHIWTFAGASDETSNDYTYKCPCINTALTSSQVPSFVGNDYFCDTAYSSYYNNYIPYSLQVSDPLWDGKGCGRTNTCCSFNSPPWFLKQLPSPTKDNVEMRVCKPDSDGSTPLEIIELYVQ